MPSGEIRDLLSSLIHDSANQLMYVANELSNDRFHLAASHAATTKAFKNGSMAAALFLQASEVGIHPDRAVIYGSKIHDMSKAESGVDWAMYQIISDKCAYARVYVGICDLADEVLEFCVPKIDPEAVKRDIPWVGEPKKYGASFLREREAVVQVR